MLKHASALPLACAFFALIGASCGDSDRQCGYLPLMPLTVGDKWAYRDCTAAPGGAEPECWGRDTLRIVGSRTFDGEEYILTERWLAFRQTPQGLSFVSYGRDGLAAPDYFLRYPVEDGAAYQYTSSRVDQPTILVTANNERVTVPAGRYCAVTYRIYVGSGPPFVKLSFAPGVGLVRIQYSNGYLGLLESADLVEQHRDGGQEPPPGICEP